jgi:hypothetical protein
LFLSDGIKHFCILLALPEGSQENKLLLNPKMSKMQRLPVLLSSQVLRLLPSLKNKNLRDTQACHAFSCFKMMRTKSLVVVVKETEHQASIWT